MTDEKPAPTIVCTLAATDTGPPCQFCGHPGGPGHGKVR